MLLQEIIQQLVFDLRERVSTEVPERGDFHVIYVEHELTAPDRTLSYFMLRVDPMPAGMQHDDVTRCLTAVGYHPSLPYQSKRTVQYGTKQEIIDLLEDENTVLQIQNLIPKLEDDLRGL